MHTTVDAPTLVESTVEFLVQHHVPIAKLRTATTEALRLHYPDLVFDGMDLTPIIETAVTAERERQQEARFAGLP